MRIVIITQNGYFKDDSKIIDDIQNSKPDIVFTAMGSP